MSSARDIGVPGAPVRVRSDPPVTDGSRPRRLDVELDLPTVSGAGTLLDQGGDRYAGALALRLDPLSVSAFGLLELPADGRPLSFVVVMGATFPPPGIQVGFGFAVTGVGGVVAVNRRVDRDALLRSIVDGAAAALLFPADPVSAAPAIIPTLSALFPPAPGYVVVGPMLQLGWGGRIVTASLALLTEVGTQVRIVVIGTLRVAIPDPAAPLIDLRATFFALVDPGEPSVVVVASLTGSRMVGIPLSGDLVLVVRGGADPTFVLSAGGFHPRFRVPRGVPPLRRIAMPLSPAPIELRAEAYVAITSNTVQFGARLELSARVAGCGLRGHLALDVLLQWHPHLYFVADLSAGIAITVAGQSLVGVQLELSLSGPTPWRARGRGSVDLFFFSVSFDFDEQWGLDPPVPPAPIDVGDELRRALDPAAPDAWVVRDAAAGAGGVRLTPAAERALGDGRLVHPWASLTARQGRVPLGVRIERFGRTPVPPQTWDITGASLGGAPVALGREVREAFPPGQFLALSEDEQLARPAFEQLRAGHELVGGPPAMAAPRPADIDYELKVVGEEAAPSGRFDARVAEALVAAATAADPTWWHAPADVVRVTTEPELALASAWDLVDAAPHVVLASVTELRQLADGMSQPGLTVVERWELD